MFSPHPTLVLELEIEKILFFTRLLSFRHRLFKSILSLVIRLLLLGENSQVLPWLNNANWTNFKPMISPFLHWLFFFFFLAFSLKFLIGKDNTWLLVATIYHHHHLFSCFYPTSPCYNWLRQIRRKVKVVLQLKKDYSHNTQEKLKNSYPSTF